MTTPLERHRRPRDSPGVAAGLDRIIEQGGRDPALRRARGERLLADLALAVAEINADRALVADAIVHGGRARHDATLGEALALLEGLRREHDATRRLRIVDR